MTRTRLQRTAATLAAATATTLTVGLLAGPADAAGRSTDGARGTTFAFQNNSWAARVTAADGLRTVRLNSSRIDCTRSTGRLSRNDAAERVAPAVARSLESFGVRIAGLSGTNVTYAENGRRGSRATNLIGDVVAAPPLPEGMSGTPGRIRLVDVRTVADTYRDRDGFHALTDVSWGEVSLTLPSSPELAPLTEPAQELVDLLARSGNGVVRQVVDLLERERQPIEIPGLASFDLGWQRAVERKSFAQAGAYGLLVEIAGNGTRKGPRIELGRAYSRTDGRATSGVVNGTAAAVRGLPGLSDYGLAKIPCVGTGGKVRTQRVRGVDVPGVVSLGTGTTSHRGKQLRAGGLVAWARSEVRLVDVPALDLRLRDVVGRSLVRQQKGRIVTRSARGTSVGRLVVGGERRALPGPGETMRLPGGGFLRTDVRTRTRRGLRVAAVVVGLPDGPTLRLGTADVSLKKR